MNLSIVIPLFNEVESLPSLIFEIKSVLSSDSLVSFFNSSQYSYEIIFIDDGSTDGSTKILEEFCKNDKSIKVISFQKNYGKSAALHAGFAKATGDYVITMDADLQDSPSEIYNLLSKLLDYDVVSGWKQKRYDPWSKTIPSKLFNFVTRKVSGINIRDFNCGLKGYRKAVIKTIEVYGEMHRYLPVLAHNCGFTISEVVVQHRPRLHGKTKFGVSRFLYGFLDLLTVLFISKFMKRPMHFFGSIGMCCVLFGILLGTYLTAIKFLFEEGINQRPLLIFTVLLIILGVQFFSLGLLGEMVIKSTSSHSNYNIKNEINFN